MWCDFLFPLSRGSLSSNCPFCSYTGVRSNFPVLKSLTLDVADRGCPAFLPQSETNIGVLAGCLQASFEALFNTCDPCSSSAGTRDKSAVYRNWTFVTALAYSTSKSAMGNRGRPVPRALPHKGHPYCRIKTLVLEVETESIINPPPWPFLSDLVQRLETSQFSALQEIQFVVDGSPFCLRGSARCAREHFESLIPAVLPADGASTGKTPTKCGALAEHYTRPGIMGDKSSLSVIFPADRAPVFSTSP
ncbi:hypothetical protein K438DRAFT_2130493 [Mycena galopus ATCC 62051]|nr:hypothetical protein K438DRAFT_2130493 [Mycena galopus ATCC 62051]